jgi:mRNA-degrading endonuclease RelE of RelBE toxin-antitoxin system
VKLNVSRGPLAADQLVKMAEHAPGTQLTGLYNAVLEIIEKVIGESDLALLPKNHLRPPLSPVLRIKKGRFRLFYIASTERQAATVLFLGQRKEGDKRDAYIEFTRHLKRGAFDRQFAELGLNPPKA